MKISRRDFLKYCISSAALLGLDASMIGKLTKALANTGPHVIWLSGSSCTGCTVSLANLISPSAPVDVADLLINVINLDFHPNLMGAAGNQAVEVLKKAASGPFILAVEGCIPSAFDGNACILWNDSGTNVTALSAVRDLAGRSIANLSIGTCASFGGICSASPNPTKATSLSTAIGKPTINIPGCPTHPDWIVSVVAQLLAGSVPALDSYRRPTAIFGRGTVHSMCPRREREEAETYGVANLCLEEMGCKGPDTMGDCPSRKWNHGTNYCMNANANCLGCTESGYPDKFVPFFRVNTTSTIPAQKALAVNSAAWDSGNLALNVAGTGKIGSQAVIKNAAGALLASTMIKRDGTWAVSQTGLASVPSSIAVLSDGTSVNANVSNAPGGKQFAISSAQYTQSTNRITVAGTGPAGATVAVNAGGSILGAVTIPASGNWTLTVTSPALVPASVTAICGGVTLTASVSGIPSGGITFAITQAVYDPGTRRLTISGRATAGGVVTLRSSGGTSLGTALTNSSGNWSRVVSNPSPVPTSVTATYGGQALTSAVQNAPGTTKTLTITRADWDGSRHRLNVAGKGTSSKRVSIYDASNSRLIGTTYVNSSSSWSLTIQLSRQPSRVRVVSNGETVERNVTRLSSGSDD